MTWAEALVKEICTADEFSLAFEDYKLHVFGSMWSNGKEFQQCLQAFLKSEYTRNWRFINNE